MQGETPLYVTFSATQAFPTMYFHGDVSSESPVTLETSLYLDYILEDDTVTVQCSADRLIYFDH